jgi:hypothetical protein
VWYLIVGKDAGDAFMEAAQLQLKLQEQEEASATFIQASKVYKKCNPMGKCQRHLFNISCYLSLTGLHNYRGNQVTSTGCFIAN